MKKLLLMGRQGAGKTSMHSIIFANYPARETMGIGYTVGVDQQLIRFMGNLTLNLWDCGGQDKLMKHYFHQQKESIFKDVEVLIYVFDVDKSGIDLEEDLTTYRVCLENLAELSEGAKVFVLIHKMDKIPPNQQKEILERKKQEISSQCSDNRVNVLGFFATSIWDETLYKAWSSIVQQMVPNMQFIKQQLKEFSDLCDADEVVLFEKQTFLIIAFYDKHERGMLKYERVSNIIKQFKLSCVKLGANIQGITVKNKFSSTIQEFNENSFIMVVYSDPRISQGAIDYNLQYARSHFKLSPDSENSQ
ncbi:hypothetical protein ABPG72_002560 [Tetrahymena utriculariae]